MHALDKISFTVNQ